MDGPAGDEREAERRFDEASPAAAEDGFVVAEGPPGKAEARAEIGVDGIAQRAEECRPGTR